jgi:hypothetical protein
MLLASFIGSGSIIDLKKTKLVRVFVYGLLEFHTKFKL